MNRSSARQPANEASGGRAARRGLHGAAMLGRSATRRATLGAVALGVVALGVWCGCTVTKDNYATLSFFFDGVPDPNASVAGAEPGDMTIASAVVVHKPFAEEKCEECHKSQYRPSRNDPAPCLSCHTKIQEEHAWTHGAVAGGACLWCHSPHESVRKWLLRGPDRKLCMQCHSATMLNGSTVPAHADEKASCLACHFGHGGDSALMLRPGATAQSPPPEGSTLPDVPRSPALDSGSAPKDTPPEAPAVPATDDGVAPVETPNPS